MLSDLLAAMRRRWYVLIVGVIASFGLGYVASGVSPPEYHARGLVLLLPSPEAVGRGGNPFLVMDGLDLPASIVVAYFQSENAQIEVAAQAPTARFVVAVDDSTRGPVISIDITDSSSSGAIKALDVIARDIPVRLAKLQHDVDAPPTSLVTSMPLTLDTRAQVDTKAATRLRIAALVGGFVGTALLTSAIDGLLLRRRVNRAAASRGSGPRVVEPSGDQPAERDERPGRSGRNTQRVVKPSGGPSGRPAGERDERAARQGGKGPRAVDRPGDQVDTPATRAVALRPAAKRTADGGR